MGRGEQRAVEQLRVEVRFVFPDVEHRDGSAAMRRRRPPPREEFITTASGFRRASSPSPAMCRVEASSGV